MKEIVIKISNKIGNDLPKILSESLSVFGSLNAGREDWARILGGLGFEPTYEYLASFFQEGRWNLRRFADALTIKAVPEEGEPHPQRATFALVPAENQSEGVVFNTPGGVSVLLTFRGREPVYQILVLTINFGRDSHFAAVQVLSRLIDAGADRLEVVRMLAAVSSDWMKDLERESTPKLSEESVTVK